MRPCRPVASQQIHAARKGTGDCPLRRQRRCRFLLTTTVRRFETYACPSCSIAHIAEAHCRLPAFPVTRGSLLPPGGRRVTGEIRLRGRRTRERDTPASLRDFLFSSTGSFGPREQLPVFKQKEANSTSTPEQISHDWEWRHGGKVDWVYLNTCSKRWLAGLPDLPGRVVPRCPNGAIREANRGWMKGKALQEAGAAWECGTA